MAQAHVHMPDVMSGLTLTVRTTGKNAMKARLWLGMQMLKLSARIMGCGIEISLVER